MKGVRIPDQDHIARYCKSSTVENGHIQASAFLLRTDEKSLSVNWLESFKCSSRESEVQELQKIYAKILNSVGAHAKIAILNIGDMCNKVLTDSPDRRKLEVRHDPSKIDYSHSGIYNLRQDDEEIAELILEILNESYSARE